MAGFKIPGIEGLKTVVSTKVVKSFPTTTNIGTSIGNIIGGNIRQNIIGFGNRLFNNGSIAGSFINQAFGNLFNTSGDSFDEMVKRADPAMQIDWAVNMPVLMNLGASVPNAPHINAYVESINVPMMSIDALPIQRAGRTVNYASTRAAGAITIEFYEDVDRMALQYLEAWKKLVLGPEGWVGYPSTYKQNITVGLIDSKNARAGSIVAIGCFPTGGVQYALTSGNSERVRLSQEFAVDHVAYVPSGQGSARIAYGELGELQQVPAEVQPLRP